MNGESDREKYGEIKSHRKTQSKIVERDTLEKSFRVLRRMRCRHKFSPPNEEIWLDIHTYFTLVRTASILKIIN